MSSEFSSLRTRLELSSASSSLLLAAIKQMATAVITAATVSNANVARMMFPLLVSGDDTFLSEINSYNNAQILDAFLCFIPYHSLSIFLPSVFIKPQNDRHQYNPQ
jgi:hypothetical protein